MHRSSQWIGITLILVGLFFLIIKFVGFSVTIAFLWPFFLLIPGLLFHLFAIRHRIPGLLVPGGILVTYGLLFLFCAIFGYESLGYLWPLFILGPGIGLLEFYLFGPRESGVLIAALIMLVIGGTFLFFSLLRTVIPYLIGIGLVIVGLYILFGQNKKH